MSRWGDFDDLDIEMGEHYQFEQVALSRQRSKRWCYEVYVTYLTERS